AIYRRVFFSAPCHFRLSVKGSRHARACGGSIAATAGWRIPRHPATNQRERNMSIKATLLASGAAVLIGLSGAAYAPAAHPVTGEALAEDQTFTYRILDEAPSVDPQLAEDVVGGEIIRDLWEGLMNQDADGNLEPGVAIDYTVSDDKLVYTFNLRDTAKWS